MDSCINLAFLSSQKKFPAAESEHSTGSLRRCPSCEKSSRARAGAAAVAQAGGGPVSTAALNPRDS